MLTYYIYVFCLQPLLTDPDLTRLFFVLLAKLLVALLSVSCNSHAASTLLGYGMPPKVPYVKGLINSPYWKAVRPLTLGRTFKGDIRIPPLSFLATMQCMGSLTANASSRLHCITTTDP